MSSPQIDILNKFGVATGGHGLTAIRLTLPRALTSTEALQLAAWLVAINREREAEFQDLLKRVLDTC
jgi:hypothetical protein